MPARSGGRKEKIVGYWKGGDGNERYPDPAKLVDKSWDKDERARVLAHLKAGKSAGMFKGMSMCRICGKTNGSGEQSDGVYRWPNGLAHYLTAHHVKPPQAFIDHVLKHGKKVVRKPKPAASRTAKPRTPRVGPNPAATAKPSMPRGVVAGACARIDIALALDETGRAREPGKWRLVRFQARQGAKEPTRVIKYGTKKQIEAMIPTQIGLAHRVAPKVVVAVRDEHFKIVQQKTYAKE